MARAKTVVVSLVLMVSAINLLIADANQTTTGNRATEKHTNSTQQLPANKQQQQENNKSTIGLNRTSAETLESAPSITSVHHQVWTSSSSGRLDELSPEVISKLRNDVPFLAAYALRPRLVGSSVSALPSGIVAGGERTTASLVSGDGKLADVPYDAVTPPIGGESRLALVAPTPTNVMPLEVGASSPQAARQSLVPKLGDFSEFNVETSSLSKSEHHHKRKTSLKRPKSGRTEEGSGQLARLGRKRAVAEDSLSQLVRRVKRKLQQKQQTASNKRRASGGSSTRQQRSKKGFKSSRGRSKSNKRKSNKRRGASRRSRRTGKKRRNTRSARSLQEKPALGGAQNDLDDETQVRDQGVAGNDLGAATKGGGPVANPTAGGGDVKGGSPSGSPRKPPFHAAGQRPKQADKFPESADGETDRTIESGSGNAIDDAAADSTGRADGDRQADEDEEEEAELDDELEAEPKRVGDDDVEEDGDTVLVEPKSDGVDDDPPLPESPGEDADEADGGANGGDSTPGVDRDARDKEEPTTTPTPLAQPESDPRGNRVNRQKPNVLPSSSSAGDEQGGEGPGGQLAGGGGIGATVGGGSTAARPASGGASDRDQDQEAGGDDADDDEFGERAPQDGRKGTKAGAGGDSESGVEFADDNRSSERDGDDNNNEDVSRDRKELGDGDRGGKGRPDDGFDDDSRRTSSGGASTDGDFGERRQNGGPRREPADSGLADGGSRRPQTGLVGGDGDKDDDDDLDYRDEIDKPSSGRKGPAIDDSTDTEKEPRTTMTTTFNDSRTSTATSINATRGSHSKTDSHCDDGSYDHHGDHHHGGHGDSHHHHDTIDWLRGAIPGEPDDDYPILSRVNVTDFSCADQKHPGYYADVEARCQIFHICQADGRQDSFLCPNGTIFSQKSLVCVWWNGFHCEDAPKFYHLNELLYKTTNGNESPQAVALPNLRPLMDGAHLAPRSMKAAANDADDGDTANANEDDSPIDGMVKATKRGRGGPQESSFMGGEAVDGAAVNRDGGGGLMRGQAGARNNIGPDDDATIQRKSTNLDDDSVDEQPPARLRARDRVPRRRRRASMRQAPPKLKSRRVSRNSRRRKLRHGIKPRRRA